MYGKYERFKSVLKTVKVVRRPLSHSNDVPIPIFKTLPDVSPSDVVDTDRTDDSSINEYKTIF